VAPPPCLATTNALPVATTPLSTRQRRSDLPADTNVLGKPQKKVNESNSESEIDASTEASDESETTNGTDKSDESQGVDKGQANADDDGHNENKGSPNACASKDLDDDGPNACHGVFFLLTPCQV
jgi:hypothetical protein